MPQMAPLSWLILFFFFISIFLMFNSLNYFIFLYENKTMQVKKNINKYNWKW
uniref:ATP synthase complex subunit 8 n=1 Tax=Doydirhynchus austriacus TaxID=166863 RepID=J9PJT6_9CUCU|nr:ATP synthase F0 subunit 8 [Doydirhynchus austriacus]